MGILYLLISIFAESGGKTVDKLNFKKTNIGYQQLILLIFGTITITVGTLAVITKPQLLELNAVTFALIAAIIIISFVSNLFEFKSLQIVNLSLREPVNNFRPVVSGLIAYVLFPAERDIRLLIAFALSTLVLYWGISLNQRAHHERRGLTLVLVSVLTKAVLPILSGFLLIYLAPEYITFFRAAGILSLTFIAFPKKQLKRFSSDKIRYGLSSGVIYSVGAVSGLYAIETLGVTLTMLLTLLGPALRYLSAHVILRERVTRRQIISSFLLVVIVVALGIL